MTLRRWITRLERVALGLSGLQNRFPPLFIVGPPRSGTTLVYLHLVNTFRLSYFPNVSKRHPHACVTAAWLARCRHAYQYDAYESELGVVSGPMAPSDGWDIFDAWFSDSERADADSTARRRQCQATIRTLEILFDAPFANKNNANCLRIEALRSVFPEALFLRVERNLYDTVSSLLAARRSHNVGTDAPFGPAPPPPRGRSFASELERVVSQTWGLRRLVERGLRDVPRHWQHCVPYEDFCRDPRPLEAWLRDSYRRSGVALPRRERHTPVAFERRGPRTRHQIRQQAIEEIVEKLERDRRAV